MQTNKCLDISLTTAKYTKLFKDISDTSRHALNDLFEDFGDDDWLSTIIFAKFRYYEICDEDEEVFVQCVTDVFNQHVLYYQELLENYSKEYDYATGNKKVVSRSDETHGTSDNSVHSVGDTTHRDYDLPNKVVDSSNENGYLTAKNTNKDENDVSSMNSHDNMYNSTITTEYKDEFLDLKRKYLNQIRNVYEEFAEKFSECFLHIY